MTLPFIDWQTSIVDTQTGRPTQAFMAFLEALSTLSLTDLSDTRITNPSNGQVLTYNASEKRWIPS